MVIVIGCATVSLVSAYRDISSGFVLATHHSSPPGPDTGLIENPGTSIFIALAAKATADKIKMVKIQSAFILLSGTINITGAAPVIISMKQNRHRRVQCMWVVRFPN